MADEHSHRSSAARYLWVWAALVALTFLSFGLTLVHVGRADMPLALAIGIVKAALVGLFFMHLLEERFSSWAALGLAVVFILILSALTAADPATRETFPAAPSQDIQLPGTQ